MDQWFIDEWREERRENKDFRKDVTTRLAELEKAKAADDAEEDATLAIEAKYKDKNAYYVSVISVVIAVAALVLPLVWG